MGLETGTYINSLNSANPGANDQVSQGDDHIRLLKSTILATFPNISGAVTPTHTELNYVDGVTSAIQTQLDAKAPLASPALTGTPTAPTAVTATSSTQLATTAFVNRNQRKFRALQGSVTTNTTLTSADVGRYIECRPTSAATITLPDISTLSGGDTFTIYNRDVNSSVIPITIARSGADGILTGPNGTVTSFSLSPGECVTLIASGSGWFIEGTFALASSYKYFKKTAAAWVRVGVSGTASLADSYNVTSVTDTGTGICTVNFATAMSDANFSISATGEYGSDGSISTGFYATTGFRLTHYNQAGTATDPTNYNAVVFASL